MGYIHDVAMSQFVLPNLMMFSAGTWAQTILNNVWSMNRTAADASFLVFLSLIHI